MKKKFVVFDVDGTLYRYALHHAVIDILMKDHFSVEIAESIELERKNWKNRTHNEVFWDFVDAQNIPFFEALHSIDPTVFENAAKQVVEEQKEHVYRYTADLFRRLKKEGRVMIAISGSAAEVVRPFCEYWGFDIIVAQEFERKDNAFTGKRKTTHDGKHKILERLIDEHDLDETDSISIGDTHYDIAVMEAVEHAIAFNPDSKLLEHAKQNNWNIVVERKNAVYELESSNGTYVLA